MSNWWGLLLVVPFLPLLVVVVQERVRRRHGPLVEFEACAFHDGKLTCAGTGRRGLLDRFVVKANGRTVPMIVTQVTSTSAGSRWDAQDVDSFMASRRP